MSELHTESDSYDPHTQLELDFSAPVEARYEDEVDNAMQRGADAAAALLAWARENPLPDELREVGADRSLDNREITGPHGIPIPDATRSTEYSEEKPKGAATASRNHRPGGTGRKRSWGYARVPGDAEADTGRPAYYDAPPAPLTPEQKELNRRHIGRIRDEIAARRAAEEAS